MKKTILVVAIALIASGCQKKEVSVAEVKMTPFEVAMSDAARNSAKSLRVLSEVNNAAKRNVLTSNQIKHELWQNGKQIRSLSGRTSVEWHGPMASFVKSFSEHLKGWDCVIENQIPASDVFLSMNLRDVSYLKILREVGAQAESRADVLIDEKNKKIFFVYHPSAGSYQ